MAPPGVAARWSGADFELSGLNNLAPADRELIEKLQPQIARHLAEPGADDPEHLLDVLDIEVEVVDDPEQARRVIAELPRSIGLDIETQPRIPGPPPALRLTKSGRRYVDQPPADTSGDALSPFRARVRLVQAYDPNKRVAFIFDMQALRFDDLAGLFDRQVLAHSMFEAMLLGANGIELPHLVDTVQLASLRLGAAHGVRKLGNVVRAELAIDLPKDQGASYWAAKNLSDQQLVYAEPMPRSATSPVRRCGADSERASGRRSSWPTARFRRSPGCDCAAYRSIRQRTPIPWRVGSWSTPTPARDSAS
jgi:hypothetical protein